MCHQNRSVKDKLNWVIPNEFPAGNHPKPLSENQNEKTTKKHLTKTKLELLFRVIKNNRLYINTNCQEKFYKGLKK